MLANSTLSEHPAKPASTTTAPQRARGTVELAVGCSENNTRIVRLFQSGCAKTRIPRSAGNGLEAILINSSGGMTGGDVINWRVDVAQDAQASVTSQACERVYKATADTAEVNIDLQVGRGAQLSWLPQETILFDQGRLRRTLNAELEPSAHALFVEPIIFGRGAMGERVNQGHLQDRWRIRQGGRLIHAEDLLISGEVATKLDQPFVLDGNCAMATILLVSPKAEGYLRDVRTILDIPSDSPAPNSHRGASAWNGKLLARIIAKDGYNLRKKLVPLINLLNFEAHVPKVWAI
ncbi:MAG: urease accessory protein UreD [Rhizobiaceae bacterium]